MVKKRKNSTKGIKKEQRKNRKLRKQTEVKIEYKNEFITLC